MKETLKKIALSFYYRFFGKKFFVFIAACILLWCAKIDASIWQMITLAFLGAEGGRDITGIIKGHAQPSQPDEKGS